MAESGERHDPLDRTRPAAVPSSSRSHGRTTRHKWSGSSWAHRPLSLPHRLYWPRPRPGPPPPPGPPRPPPMPPLGGPPPPPRARSIPRPGEESATSRGRDGERSSVVVLPAHGREGPELGDDAGDDSPTPAGLAPARRRRPKAEEKVAKRRTSSHPTPSRSTPTSSSSPSSPASAPPSAAAAAAGAVAPALGLQARLLLGLVVLDLVEDRVGYAQVLDLSAGSG